MQTGAMAGQFQGVAARSGGSPSGTTVPLHCVPGWRQAPAAVGGWGEVHRSSAMIEDLAVQYFGFEEGFR